MCQGTTQQGDETLTSPGEVTKSIVSVRLSDVEKEYPDGVVGATDLNFSIDDGEFVIFVEASGCDKTTTLELIAGLQRPTQVTISFGDTVVNESKPRDRNIAMVFQDYALYPHKTIRENMKFGLKFTTDFSGEEVDERVIEYAELLGIEQLLDQKPDQLSGGQQQRVALGRCIAKSSDVFLLDEPLSNLDAILRTHLRAELQQLQQELAVTTIYVTHDQTEAMTMADRIVVMNDGRVQQIGTPSELYNKPANEFVAQFIGSPSMNLLDATVDDGSVHTDSFSFESGNLQTHLDGRSSTVRLGVRAEDIVVTDDDSRTITSSDVKVVEMLGSENMTHLQLESGVKWVAKVCEEVSPEIDETVQIGFRRRRCMSSRDSGS